MNITKTKIELVEIFAAFTVLGQRDLAIWYPISKNMQKLKPIIQDYNDLKDVIVKKFAILDEEGKPKIVNGNYEFGEKLADATKALEVLNQEEISVELETISKAQIKDDKLPGSLLAILLDIIVD